MIRKEKRMRTFGFAKKTLDLTQKLDYYNELNGLLQTYINEKQQELLCNQTTDESITGNQQENIECSNTVTLRWRE
ncbi:hypothetical protein GLOIN_2v1873051 [Rhizophagus irregularis DAOM 181602=DAOM 197198]|nr:hypothetical protein GLOIN_2v1873051 [Rhizophagus irregularis DAOM 181602=DAOM 197198]